MASVERLEHSIERAEKHYSSLFLLPSYHKIVSLTSILCALCGILTIPLLHGSLFRINVAVLAAEFVLLLFSMSFISDLVMRHVFMRFDPIYNIKRCAGLSMFSILLWLGYLLIGCFLSLALATWHLWIDLFLIGYAAVFILRLIVLSTTSFTSYVRLISSSILQPTLCLLPMFYLPYSVGYNIENTYLAYFLISIPVSIFTAFTLIRSVDSVGLNTLRVPTTSVLKAFLANWMEYLNAPLEKLFETFGRERDIDFSILAFKGKEKIECLFVVSSFHPGPFRNVGSSFLPFIIKDALEKKVNCIVAVPHGLFGHEFDLSSQLQNRKVLKSIIDSSQFKTTEYEATPCVSGSKDVASVSCQKFGNCAILTLTLAPETTEDFPKELGDFIVEEASRCGLDHVVIINAHNSINGLFNVQTAMEPLKAVIHEILWDTSKLQTSTFEVGGAKAIPEEYTLEDGMGPEGISV